MGIIILRDHPAIGGGIVAAMKQLEELGIWLSVVVAGEAADPGAIVEAIKAGALDYIPIPVDPTLLHVSLTKVCAEDSQRSGMRRRRIEARDKIARLTMRESEVLEFLAAGHSSKAIAHQLGISPRTVELHRSRMMSKLGASHTAGAVRIALDASGAHVTQYAH
jgi:FixJ family two-component response regulator